MRRLVAAAAVVGPILYWRRRASTRDRVAVQFDDGSALTVDRGPDADALLAIARSAL